MGVTAFRSGDGTAHELYLVGTTGTDAVLTVSKTVTDDASIQSSRTVVVTANGDLNPSIGGMKQIVGYFVTTNQTTSASAVAMKLGGVAGMTQVLMLYPGSVIGVGGKANANVTAGTIRFAVTKNGTTVFSAVNSATGVSIISGTQAKDTDTFAAGDTIGVKCTTSAAYAPTTLEWVVGAYLEI